MLSSVQELGDRDTVYLMRSCGGLALGALERNAVLNGPIAQSVGQQVDGEGPPLVADLGVGHYRAGAEPALLRGPAGGGARRVVPAFLLAARRVQPPPMREAVAEPACRRDRKCPSRFGEGRLVRRDPEALIRSTGGDEKETG